MGDVDGGIGDEGDQYGDGEPLENQHGIVRIGLEGFGHGHCTPRAFGERSPTGTIVDLIAIFPDILCGYDGTGDEGGYKDHQEEDGVTDVEVLEQNTSRAMRSVHIEQSSHKPTNQWLSNTRFP